MNINKQNIYHNTSKLIYADIFQAHFNITHEFRWNIKVAKPGFDCRCGSTSLSLWKRHLILFLTLKPSCSLPVVVAQQSAKRHENRLVLCWSGSSTTDAEQWFIQRKKNTDVMALIREASDFRQSANLGSNSSSSHCKKTLRFGIYIFTAWRWKVKDIDQPVYIFEEEVAFLEVRHFKPIRTI